MIFLRGLYPRSRHQERRFRWPFHVKAAQPAALAPEAAWIGFFLSRDNGADEWEMSGAMAETILAPSGTPISDGREDFGFKWRD